MNACIRDAEPPPNEILADERAAFYRLPCIDGVLDRLDQLETIVGRAGLNPQNRDAPDAGRHRCLEERRSSLEAEIAREMGVIRRALKASITSGYPRGHTRARDLMMLERLLGPDVLRELEEVDWLASILETTDEDDEGDSASFHAVIESRRAELASDITMAVATVRRHVGERR